MSKKAGKEKNVTQKCIYKIWIFPPSSLNFLSSSCAFLAGAAIDWSVP